MDIYEHFTDDCEKAQQDIYDKYLEIPMPIPGDAKGRYVRLKDYIGEWHFYDCKFNFLSDAPEEVDIHSILKEIQLIEDIRNHKLLRDKAKRSELSDEAKDHLKRGSLNAVKDDEKLSLLICILLEDNWFDIFPLADEAFELDDHANNIESIGEVYGKYFRFYEYLKYLLKKIDPKLLINIAQKSENTKPLKTKKIKPLTFKDIFNKDNEDKADKILEILLRDLPEKVTIEYDELSEPFISKTGNNIVWNISVKNAVSYIAGIFRVCSKKYWLGTHSMDTYVEIFANTFNVKITSRTNFRKALLGEFDRRYFVPFELAL